MIADERAASLLPISAFTRVFDALWGRRRRTALANYFAEATQFRAFCAAARK
jgi:hypothetical protein